MEDKKAKINFGVFKRLIKYARPYKSYLILAFIFTMGLAVLSPLRPSVIGNIVDNYIVQDQDAKLLLIWTLVVVAMLFGEGLFQYFNTYFSNLLAQSIIRDMRKKLYKHLSQFKMKFFDKNPLGSVVTRTVNDLEAISEVFSQGLINMLGDIVVLITILGWMFYTNWVLSLFILIPIPILLIATRLFARAVKKGYKNERKEVNALNNFVQERLSGMAILQMFNRENVEQKKFEKINERHKAAHIHLIWANSIFFPFVEFLNSLSIAFLLVFSAWSLSSGLLLEGETTGAIIKFTLWVQMLYRPIRQLADKFNTLQRGIVRAERVFNTIDTDEKISDEGTIDDHEFDNKIVFENVSMAYKNDDYVLKDINLEIQPNTTVAFAGATGAGKTSIVNLLSRFYEFQKGDIKVGDISIRDIELNYLRENISIVLQDVFLFSDTILNNITLGNDKISREEVIEAAKTVDAHQFIEKLPGKYDYQVGERGGVLSVGQRQLLAFIRAYVHNPSILVLDEATSSVDNESELMIQKATEKLTEGRTSIVIAHRLSTIQKADKIVVMEKGEIVETGTHLELLDKGGYYKNLFEKQFLGEKTA